MNRFQVLLNQLKNNTERLDVKGDETNQNLISANLNIQSIFEKL